MQTPLLPAQMLARWLLIFVIIAGLYFIRGFLVPVLVAMIISLASWPLYTRIQQRFQNNNLSASIALIIVLLVIITPISMGLNFAIQEASALIRWLLTANRDGMPTPLWITELPFVGEKITSYWDEYLGEPQALGSLIQMVSGEHIGNVYRMLLSATGNLFHLFLAVLFMLITLFFIYRDGDFFLIQLDKIGEKILPHRWHSFSRVVPATINSTVVGMGLIAIGEGIVLGLAYWVAGVPSPALLGLITGFMALIPGGAPLSVSVVSLYLIGSGNTFAGLGLWAWGAIELFIVDKTIRPRLVGGPVAMPFLPTFFGLVGGVQTMGMVGLFVGPVLMALLVAIWREWLRDDNTIT